MSAYTLEIKLLSDTAFSMGAGVSGVVDSEIQHDEHGLPTLSGRAIKGLLVNECSEILYALGQTENGDWHDAAQGLFGSRGDLEEESSVYFGDAGIAPDLAACLSGESGLTRQDILDALTDIRRQTAMSEKGAPEDESLRSIRVLIRGITLYAPIRFMKKLGKKEKALLAACVLSLRRAGLGRTRGKGKLEATITDCPLDPKEFAACDLGSITDLSIAWFEDFKTEVAQ